MREETLPVYDYTRIGTMHYTRNDAADMLVFFFLFLQVFFLELTIVRVSILTDLEDSHLLIDSYNFSSFFQLSLFILGIYANDCLEFMCVTYVYIFSTFYANQLPMSNRL